MVSMGPVDDEMVAMRGSQEVGYQRLGVVWFSSSVLLLGACGRVIIGMVYGLMELWL